MKIIDMHCDTLPALLHQKRQGESYGLDQNLTQISLDWMQQSNYLLQNFAVFINLAKTQTPLQDALEMIDLFYSEMDAHHDIIRPVRCFADIEKNQSDGVMSALLTGEEGQITLGKTEFLHILYRLGMRMMTLTWNHENSLGYPNKREQGLKEQGICFLEEMEHLGMIIDVSHLSDAGFYDVLAHTKKPFVASHSNARSLCTAPRNLADDMIRKLAKRGGIAGINFCQHFLGAPDANETYLDLAVQHMKYMINLGGEDFVALGSDFDGIDRYADIPDCSIMPKLVQKMKKAGLTPTQIEKICYQNTLRIYRELL